MLVFVSNVDFCLAGREATLRERVFVSLWPTRLDRALAAGTSPESSALLCLRAQRLVRPEMRRELAAAVRRMVKQSREPLPPCPALSLEAHHVAIGDCAAALSELADRLLAPAPVSAVGVARASLLITDLAGRLYCPSGGEQLSRSIQDAIAGLDPRLSLDQWFLPPQG